MPNTPKQQMESHPKTPPAGAEKCLQWFVPEDIKSPLLGDLEEEYSCRASSNEELAKRWYWQQTFNTTLHYVNHYLASERFLNRLVFLLSVLLFPTLVISISWLSTAEVISEPVMASTVDGKLHSILFAPEVVVNGLNAMILNLELDMFLHFPAFLWATFALTDLYLRNKMCSFSAHQLAGWGSIHIFLPYLGGLLYFEFLQPDIKQVGPLLAFMAMSACYLIPPIAYCVWKKTRKA